MNNRNAFTAGRQFGKTGLNRLDAAYVDPRYKGISIAQLVELSWQRKVNGVWWLKHQANNVTAIIIRKNDAAAVIAAAKYSVWRELL